MAVVAGTVVDAWGFTTPVGPKKTSAPAAAETCYVTVTYAGTYVQGTGGTVTAAAIQTKIQNEKRDGKTVTVYSIAPVQPGDEAGVAIFAQYPTLSTGTYTNLLNGADNATEHAAAVMGTFGWGIVYAVGYTSA